MKKRGCSVRKMLASCLSSDLTSRLIAELGEDRALRIWRTVRTMAIPAHREAYALTCIRNQEEIDTHNNWLEKHPPYEDVLDVDEQRAMPTSEIRARDREIREREERIAVLRGEMGGFDMLVRAKGKDRATATYQKIVKAFGPKLMTEALGKRINAMLKKASSVRHPDAYIAVCIKNEHARLAKKNYKAE